MLSQSAPILLCQLLLMSTSLASKHYFTSTSHISKLLSMKCRLADALLGYADSETMRLERVREFARSLQRENEKPQNNGETAAETVAAMERGEHPVAAFLTIRRMGQEWRRLLGDCGNAPDALLRSAGLELPTSDDFDGAADALVRLQDVYGVSADSMARGQLRVGSQASFTDRSHPLLLSVDDCVQLVRRAFNRALDLIGMDWIRLLTSDAFPLDQRSRALPEVLDILQSRFLQTAEVDLLGSVLGSAWKDANGNATKLAESARASVEDAESRQNDAMNYRKLCKDGSFIRKGSSSHLICRFTVPHPFFTLTPVKEELLNQDPRVVFLYDVMTDKESTRLMEVSDPVLSRARVLGGQVADFRISKSAFLDDNFDWSVRNVNRRLGHITGLNVTDSDPLQMGNYGIGGQYEPHMDSFGHGVTSDNDRVATVLLYMNNVTQGGGTVFPRLGLRVMPVKNGALFWYNLRRNSSDIYDTTHAACPVIEGSKWVANKWFNYLGQMYHRPCSRIQTE